RSAPRAWPTWSCSCTAYRSCPTAYGSRAAAPDRRCAVRDRRCRFQWCRWSVRCRYRSPRGCACSTATRSGPGRPASSERRSQRPPPLRERCSEKQPVGSALSRLRLEIIEDLNAAIRRIRDVDAIVDDCDAARQPELALVASWLSEREEKLPLRI